MDTHNEFAEVAYIEDQCGAHPVHFGQGRPHSMASEDPNEVQTTGTTVNEPQLGRVDAFPTL